MFVFVATALAGTIIGWPCQRLNWGWRNVWSTCSINSYTFNAGGEVAANVPTGFRISANSAASANGGPSRLLAATGIFTPTGTDAPGLAAPTLLCVTAPATGSGHTANLRNRCRRAIDAYGALVRACAAPNAIAGNRGPVAGLAAPDYLPAAGHHPHVSNVQGLTHNAQFCTNPTFGVSLAAPSVLATPSNTCPGLLGWFTVVYNVCGFTNAPGLKQAASPDVATAVAFQPYTTKYFPLGSTATPDVIPGGALVQGTSVGYFCSNTAPSTAATPAVWNQGAGTGAGQSGFRTSRCRKALDQFGRTANRCHVSTTGATGPAQAGGYSDPLRVLAVGVSAINAVPNTANSPFGLNYFAPLCN